MFTFKKSFSFKETLLENVSLVVSKFIWRGYCSFCRRENTENPFLVADHFGYSVLKKVNRECISKLKIPNRSKQRMVKFSLINHWMTLSNHHQQNE